MSRRTIIVTVVLALGVAASVWMWLMEESAPSGGAEGRDVAGSASAPTQLRDSDSTSARAPGVSASEDAAKALSARTDPSELDGGERPPSAETADTTSAEADVAKDVTAWLARNADAAEKLVDRYCEESQRLKEAGLGEESSSRARDAWPYMAVRVDWEGGKSPPGLLHLSDPLRQRLRQYGPQWPSKIRDYDLAGLDFTWMRELHQFDHWNVLREMPARAGPESGLAEAPIPNFFELQNWAKLRLARALSTGDFAEASADLRQLARLLRTTGLVIADMVAFKLLDLEREAFEAARAQGKSVGGWSPIAREELERYRRVARSAPQFLQPGVSSEVMKRALECNAVSRCSAIFEGLSAHVTLARFAPRDSTGAMKALADASGCDAQTLQWIGASSSEPPGDEALAMMIEDDGVLERFLSPPSDGGR